MGNDAQQGWTSEDVALLGTPHKTIREPVHGDVFINRIEVEIIDTKLFQRLRDHKQLGLVLMVYPGAEHSRFQHALGTLFLASQMLETVNKNAKRYADPPATIVSEYGKLVTRTAALIHDIVNLPFGHTLEDEGLLSPRDWRDEDRVKEVFAETGELFGAVVRLLREYHRASAEEKAKILLDDVRSILTFDEKITTNKFAYAADIVGNTFCSDLLDYLERDAYFTGLGSKFRADRSRALSYLYIPLQGSDANRLVVRLWHHGRFKDDVLSELFSILRARKDLAEAVYFHHTKVCLSAMLIAAVQRSGLIPSLRKDPKRRPWLVQMTDHDLFNMLKSDEAGQTAKTITEDIEARRLYVPVYQVSGLTSQQHLGGTLDFKTAINAMRAPSKGADERLKRENEFAEYCNLQPGQVIIHCADTEMNLKAAKARVLWEPNGVGVLEEIDVKQISNRIATLEDEHKSLWKLYVFADSRASPDQKQLLAAACFDTFKRENEALNYREVKNAQETSLQLWAKAKNVPPEHQKLVREALFVEARDQELAGFLDTLGHSDKKLPTQSTCNRVLEFLTKRSGRS